MRKLILLISSLFLVFPLTAGAATFKGGESYNLTRDQVIEGDLFVGAGAVTLNGAVLGDVNAAGGNLTVIGPVAEDLILTGGSISALGNVGEDAKIAGGNVTVGGTVGGELTAAGGMVSVLPGTEISGDATLSGGKLIFGGLTDGDLLVYGEDVEVLGTVKGDVRGKVTRLTLGKDAVIGGGIIYSGPNAATINEGASIAGAVDYTFAEMKTGSRGAPDLEVVSRFFKTVILTMLVLKYLSLLLAGALLTLWFTRKSDILVERTRKHFGLDLLLGFAVMMLTPMALVLLLLTGVGGPFAVLGFAVTMALAVVATIYAGVTLGVLARDLVAKKKHAPADWKSALLGVTILAVLMFIPIIGWLCAAVMVMAVYGSLVRLAYDRFWLTR